MLGDLLESSTVEENSHLAIDLLGNEIIWNEPKSGKIWAIDLKTNATRLLFQNAGYRPSIVEVFAHSIYFYDGIQSAIFRVNKHGHSLEMVHQAKEVSSLRILHDMTRPAWLNRCYTNPCSHLCLPAPLLEYPPRHPSFVCACADGWLLSEDGETCRQSKQVLKKAMLSLTDAIPALFSNPGSMDAFKHTLFGSQSRN
ncbi:hypothetical protein Ciccas_003319 [Cichlidogyrus casuarinus]|uniref:EGF-like domain-containing protein n=1 Tax=Cichlidogyrus casuarinus TaxID=1844966 RepID=A0ABD2QEP8_9PLAT